ncbi:DnaJ domain-containing protein [Melanogaster broomeanus]|nr:DnaJ domain-containing protein [Melanogaster broomeanus]
MATNLYEILGISRLATSEEIRKAYRRKALETHPDRLPQGATAGEKAASEEMFRKVNNAYEVLSDLQKRQAYDQHGVWPPPTPAPNGPFTNGPRFPDRFSQDPFFSRGPRMDPFGFSAPFTLFNSIFGDLHRAFQSDPFPSDPFGHRGFGSGPFGGGGFPFMFPSGFNGGGIGSTTTSRMQGSGSGRRGGNWVSESWTTSSVNGVTHTKCVRRDSEGNEHVTYKLPDGTERYTLNAPPTYYPSQTGERVIPPPPPYSEAIAQPPVFGPSRSSRPYQNYPATDRGNGQGANRESGSAFKFWKS